MVYTYYIKENNIIFSGNLITSTHRTPTYSSQWRNPIKMDHVHSWTPKLHQVPITTPHYNLQETKTDQYLHWNSNHFIGAKHSVYNTLAHKANVVSHNQQSPHKDLHHIRKALQACHFPTWTLNRLQQKLEHNTKPIMNPCSMYIQPNNNIMDPTTIPTTRKFT